MEESLEGRREAYSVRQPARACVRYEMSNPYRLVRHPLPLVSLCRFVAAVPRSGEPSPPVALPFVEVTCVNQIRIHVENADALEYPADVLALKHAQALYGVDRDAHARLVGHGREIRLPRESEIAFVQTDGAIASNAVLFVGAPPLSRFRYPEIREFGRNVLAWLGRKASEVSHVALTVHGSNFGLDELEAFKAQIAGIVDALRDGEFPPALAEITFVELDRERSQRLQAALRQLVPNGLIQLGGQGLILGDRVRAELDAAGPGSDAKSHVFVAMPFEKGRMNELFHYGIQGAVHAVGLLCERTDQSAFTGDVMERVKARIESANIVVAELSTANPNVYLEVGYAWGCRIPTILLVRADVELPFDVRGQKYLKYDEIQDAERLLAAEIRGLLAVDGRPRSPVAPRVGKPARPSVYYDRVPPRELRRPGGQQRAVARAPKTWPNGCKLRVRFLGGTPAQRDLVREHAPEWTEHANLRIEFTDVPNAEIRVAFDPSNGQWSYIGKDALEVPFEAPTMNFARLDRAAVLHLFGRAIGLEPMHQNPHGGMMWNEAAVAADLSGAPNFWDRETVRREFIDKYSVDWISGTQFDPKSVMLLPIPASWTLNGVGTALNESLSPGDKTLAAELYPRAGA